MSAMRIASLAVLVALAGCNADERAKTVTLEKGTYRGAADTQLSETTRQALVKRAGLQRFEGGLSQALRPTTLPDAPATIEGRVAGQRF